MENGCTQRDHFLSFQMRAAAGWHFTVSGADGIFVGLSYLPTSAVDAITTVNTISTVSTVNTVDTVSTAVLLYCCVGSMTRGSVHDGLPSFRLCRYI